MIEETVSEDGMMLDDETIAFQEADVIVKDGVSYAVSFPVDAD